MYVCRVEEVDPPAGSGALRPPAGGRAATMRLGAGEGQSTDTPPPVLTGGPNIVT